MKELKNLIYEKSYEEILIIMTEMTKNNFINII